MMMLMKSRIGVVVTLVHPLEYYVWVLLIAMYMGNVSLVDSFSMKGREELLQ